MSVLLAANISPHIFREYDIRGRVPEELNEEVARQVAQAFATKIAKEKRIDKPVISAGWDGRLSSPSLKEAISKGLTEGGADVLEVGLGPTPLTYYSVFARQTDGCIMITGSHNPPDYNGLKMMIGKRPFFGAQIQQLYKDIIEGLQQPDKPGSVKQSKQLKGEYIAMLAEVLGQPAHPLHVVWDAGNGAAGEIVEQLAKQLPGQHEVLFSEIDGTFPNHHPDPSVEENMLPLKQRVMEVGADIGIAFDGDGDRIGVIDGQGRIWAGDQILAICAEAVLRKHAGAEIIVDVKTSQGVIEHIAVHGGKATVWKTGHSNMKSKLAETHAPLAGEMSGHIFFADDYYGFDDALYGAIRLLNMLGNSKKTAAEHLDALPKWASTPEMRIDCADDKKFMIIEQLATTLQAQGKQVLDVDGVRVTEEGGWWLLRASNTQPVLVARAEAKTEAALESVKQKLQHYLKAFDITL